MSLFSIERNDIRAFPGRLKETTYNYRRILQKTIHLMERRYQHMF